MLHKLSVIAATLLALQAAAAARVPPTDPAAAPVEPHFAERRSLISGGSDAPANRYPYMCALGRASKSADTVEADLQGCGATLIAPQIALTAAHCVGDEERGVLRRGLAVLCGTVRLGSSSGKAEFRRVSAALLHPGSKEAVSIGQRMAAEGKSPQSPDTATSDLTIDELAFSAGDLALLLLDSPIDSLAPVGLASQADWQAIAKAGLELRTIGWGATDASRGPRSFPTRLQETALPLVSDKRCAEEYTDVGSYGEHVDPSIAICAGYLAGVPPLPCNGDSGGPLLYTPSLDDPATHKQVGIVSGGAGECGGNALPGVFTKVPVYYDWIQKGLQSVQQGQGLPGGQQLPGAPAAQGQATDAGGDGTGFVQQAGPGAASVASGGRRLLQGGGNATVERMCGSAEMHIGSLKL